MLFAFGVFVITDEFILGDNSRELIVTKNDAPRFADYAIRVAGVTEVDDAYRCARRSPNHHTLVITLAGEGELVTAQGRYRLQPETLAVVHSQRAFSYQLYTDHWQFMWFILEEDRAWQFLQKLPALPGYPVAAQTIKPLLTLLGEPISLATKQAITRELYLLLSNALSACEVVSSLQERLSRLFIAVDQQLHLPWTAADLARQLHCSQPSLHRYCQQIYQQTPLQIVSGLRMQRARVLLRETDWNLDMIAAQLGYSSGLALSKAFKQKQGQSPLHYRNAAQ
ncbi:MAG TPA: AraC family transcriptional regulator [Marinagarivorans sp.]